MSTHPIQLAGGAVGVVLIVWGAETFAKHLATASARLGVSAFALAVLLAGAEPEELATTAGLAEKSFESRLVIFGEECGGTVRFGGVVANNDVSIASRSQSRSDPWRRLRRR
jgi:Ca2+/Na+ antiporter